MSQEHEQFDLIEIAKIYPFIMQGKVNFNRASDQYLLIEWKIGSRKLPLTLESDEGKVSISTTGGMMTVAEAADYQWAMAQVVEMAPKFTHSQARSASGRF